MIQLTRRRLLFGGTVVGAGIAAAAAIGTEVLPLRPDERIKQVIRARLEYLDIPEEVLDAFIRDYKNDRLYSRYNQFGRRAYGVRNAAQRLRLVNGSLDVERLERHIVAHFLQSTNFFREGADVGRPISYWRYWDPYKLGCSNQFATLRS